MLDTCLKFGEMQIKKGDIEGKRVIEVGSKNVNGSIRGYVESLNPKEYIGIDLDEGDCVDIVMDASKLVEHYGKESFDYVICMEMIEHVQDWRKIIENLKQICKKEGFILITTRSPGFRYHAYPFDFWRFEIEDIEKIFSDFEVLSLESDTEKGCPGVFTLLKKPINYISNDLKDIELFFIATGKKVLNYDDVLYNKFLKWYEKDKPKRDRETKINRYLVKTFSDESKLVKTIKKIYRFFVRKV